jgi:hypothetical protein
VAAIRDGKEKKAREADKWQRREMEIVRWVWMGEDHDAVQAEYESEPPTDPDDGDGSDGEEAEFGDADAFVVVPWGTAGPETAEGSGTSSSAPEVRKRVAEDNMAPTEEAKQA